MRPKKYPYSGDTKAKETTKKETTKEDKLELVIFPNVAIKKDLLRHIYAVVKNHDGTTIIDFRIPKNLGYEEQRVKVRLGYRETLIILEKEVKGVDDEC